MKIKNIIILGLIIAVFAGPYAFCDESDDYETESINEKGIVKAYKAFEGGIVTTYKWIENAFIAGYKIIEKRFVKTFLATKDGIYEPYKPDITIPHYAYVPPSTSKDDGDEEHE